MVFSALLAKIIPLYALIALGYYAGKKFEIHFESIARLAVNVVGPVFFFGYISRAEFEISYLIVPIITIILSATMAAVSYFVARRFWKDGTENLISSGICVGNSGYFGVPVALALFEPHVMAMYLLANFGDFISQKSFGYWIMVKGKHSLLDSFKKLIVFPPFLAVLLALICNFAGWRAPEMFNEIFDAFKGAFMVLGMMVIGMAFSDMKGFRMEWKFLGVTTGLRFIAWPLLVLGVIILDKTALHILNQDIYTILMLFAVLPIGSNTAIFAADLDLHPRLAAMAVLMTTLLSFFGICIISTMI